MRELSLKLNELETKLRTTKSKSGENEATIQKANERLSSLENVLMNLSIDEDSLEGWLRIGISMIYFFFLFIDKPESKSQSKVQAPNQKSRIQKGKEEFGLWAVL